MLNGSFPFVYFFKMFAKKKKTAYLLCLLSAFLFTTLAQAKLLTVYLNEDPLIKVRAFKGIHKEALMRRSLRTNNGNERNAPLAEAISRNKELQLQEKRISSQQESFISSIPEHWKVAEILRENGRKQKAVTSIASNSVVIDIGDSDEREAIRTLMLMPGVRKVDVEHKIKLKTFQSLDQIGATAVYEAFGMSELDAGRGIKICVIDDGNYMKTRMMDDEGFSLPLELPSDRGEEENINNKLIISRKYGTHRSSYPTIAEDFHGIQ